MFVLPATIVLLAFASIVNGLTLEYIENDKICTQWVVVIGASISIDEAQCSSKLDYEIKQGQTGYVMRFCCTRRSVVQSTTVPTPNGCGHQAVNPILSRIVGGYEAIPNSWPWLVSLQYNGNHFCGGTLIDQYHVLTAAHCLQDRSMLNSGLTIVAGLHSRSQPQALGVQRKGIASVVNHEAYNDDTNENDIAIIRLSSPVTVNNYVNFACLPGADPALNNNVMIAGWGTTSFEGRSSDPLLQASVLIMDICKQVYNFDERKQLCAGNYQYSRDTCQGDSGGPLMYQVNGQWTVNGIVSYGDECAKLYRPGVYTRVSAFLSWIQTVTSTSAGK